MIKWQKACDGDLFRLTVIKTALRYHPQLISFLFRPDKPEMFACPDKMLARAGGFSHGEQLLVQFAVDVWKSPSNEMHLRAWDMCCILDSKNFAAIIDAMILWRAA